MNEEIKETETLEAEGAPQKEEKPKKEKKDAKVLKLKEEIARLERELEETKANALKEIAETQTTRRRMKEEMVNERKYASMKVIEELINPIDMLVKVVNAPVSSPELQNYLYGFQMIANQLIGVLNNEGLKEIECKVDQVFDPATMQVVSSEEQEGLEESKVLKVLQTGYMFKERILRPCMVHVAISKKTEESKEENISE